jgi:predicted exporter
MIIVGINTLRTQDTANPDLRENLLNGAIQPAKFVDMKAEVAYLFDAYCISISFDLPCIYLFVGLPVYQWTGHGRW